MKKKNKNSDELKRKAPAADEALPQYKKISTGTLILRPPIVKSVTRIKSGQVIRISTEAIERFIDDFVKLDEGSGEGEVIMKKKKKPADIDPELFTVKHIGGGRYNIINIESEKVMNEDPLKKDEAAEFKANLETVDSSAGE